MRAFNGHIMHLSAKRLPKFNGSAVYKDTVLSNKDNWTELQG